MGDVVEVYVLVVDFFVCVFWSDDQYEFVVFVEGLDCLVYGIQFQVVLDWDVILVLYQVVQWVVEQGVFVELVGVQVQDEFGGKEGYEVLV